MAETYGPSVGIFPQRYVHIVVMNSPMAAGVEL